ncbi:MAG: hydroxyacylglutathione hydrolase [Burkholderiaceae bacterium]|nr:hydroxyacylglutathione hydrolase [Burkholderiaceae bacterium]
MNLVPLPALSDNVIWMLHDGRHALVVDPGDAQPVLNALAGGCLELAAILVTHHHGDHVGGVTRLREGSGCAVYGPAREPIPEPFTPRTQGDGVDVMGLHFDVLYVPGHTAGHLAYVLREGPPDVAPLVFCGDTLFSGGCGRLFEGTPEQMLHSLDALAALPEHTRVCCAHEYTLSNLRFARAVEPDNIALAEYAARCEALRAQGQLTLPSRIALERQINPFLRLREATVRAAVCRHAGIAPGTEEVALFGALRQWKNEF